MRKQTLKRMNRYELLDIMYRLRQENDELKQRCESAEEKLSQLQEEWDEKEKALRQEYESRTSTNNPVDLLHEKLLQLETQMEALKAVQTPTAGTENAGSGTEKGVVQ
jgi:uncharacterized coiled-coil DUF342 family protein